LLQLPLDGVESHVELSLNGIEFHLKLLPRRVNDRRLGLRRRQLLAIQRSLLPFAGSPQLGPKLTDVFPQILNHFVQFG
jgi:hypothetical protein